MCQTLGALSGTTPHLLFVDDEPALRALMAERLRERGFEVAEAENGEKALQLLDQFAFDLLITDLRMPGIDGAQVIQAARERYPGIVAIVITGYGTVKDAVDAIKRGASDFIAKPFQFDELMHVLQKGMEQRRLSSENAYLRSQLEERYQFGGIIGRSRAMQALFQMLETVARSSSTILVTGETGTGKEVVARAIHHNSPRKAHRFVALNCSAIPETLLEAELFGHVRGAFTGAVGARQGRFEQAHKGTLFLDEVGTMSTGLQMKLLRALQEREFERVGDNQTIKVDVRVIAATNSELGKMVSAGAFREDLYYRLNVIPIQLPPLRDRREDIPLLVKHFLEKFTARTNDRSSREPDRGIRLQAEGTPMVVSQTAMRALMAYTWPGNVRQLENAIERAVALGDGRKEIDVGDLPHEIQAMPQAQGTPFVDFPDDGLDLPRYLADIERDLIQRSLERTKGNRNKAAELLRIKRTTLVEKLRRLGPD
jgi:two-component system, NtrC family, response regulator AtoC